MMRIRASRNLQQNVHKKDFFFGAGLDLSIFFMAIGS